MLPVNLRRSIVLVIAACLPAVAHGQIQRSFALGDRLRIYVPNAGVPTLVGKVTGIDEKTITMHLDGRPGEFFFLRDEIRAIEVSTHTYRKTTRGAVLGGLMGAVVGVVFSPKNNIPLDASQRKVPSVLPAVAVGVGAGALLGAVAGFANKRDVWAPVTIMPPR
jgi:hypothetical protein